MMDASPLNGVRRSAAADRNRFPIRFRWWRLYSITDSWQVSCLTKKSLSEFDPG